MYFVIFAALLAATASLFQRGDVEEYIHYLWYCLAKPAEQPKAYYGEPTVAIHICRIHVNRFWGRKVDRTIHNKKSNDDVRNLYKSWMVKFIRTKSIQSIQRRMYDILMISGSLYLTEQVSRRLAEFENGTNYEGTNTPFNLSLNGIMR